MKTATAFCSCLLALCSSAAAGAGPRAASPEAGTYGKNNSQRQPLDVADPVSAANGVYHFSLPFLSQGGPLGMNFTLYYSRNIQNYFGNLPVGVSDPFWWSPLATAMLNSAVGNFSEVFLEDGDRASFVKNADGTYGLYEGAEYPANGQATPYVLKETASYVYFMDPASQRVYVFDKVTCNWGLNCNALRLVIDRNGNTLTYSNSATPGMECYVASISDGLGRSLNFTWQKVSYLTALQKVSDQNGREVTFAFETSAADNGNYITLRSVSDAMGSLYTFTYQPLGAYDRGNVKSITFPKGNIPLQNTYINSDIAVGGTSYNNSRVSEQVDAYGNKTAFAFAPTGYTTTVSYPDTAAETYEHSGSTSPPSGFTDAAGKRAAFTKNAQNQVTGITDRAGSATAIAPHAETGDIASVTNPRGESIVRSFTKQAQGITNPLNGEVVSFDFYDLTRVDYPDGTSERLAYDARGNVLGKTDRAGQTTVYTVNASGQVLTATNPSGGVTTHTWNADGTMASTRDSGTGTFTFAYDAYKRLTRTTDPDGSFTQIAYDLNDRVVSTTDENGGAVAFAYDANGNLVSKTDPAGKSTTFDYDLMDRVTGVTNRLGKRTAHAYDSRGRKASITDPVGRTTSFGYDSRGWLDRTTFGGQDLRAGYDFEGGAVSSTTPLGHEATQERDGAGYVTAATDPLGQTTTFVRDSLNRLTGSTDPLGRATSYTYNEKGLLSGVVLPAVGPAAYTYNSLGLLSGIADLKGGIWGFGYTGEGRRSSLTDPLGQEIRYGYDGRGRLKTTTFPDGKTAETTYDGASNPLRILFSGPAGPDISNVFDQRGRLVSTGGIALAYDDEGGITATDNGGTMFGASYDDAGRLSAASYNGGLFSVTYTYDATTGLLSGVSDGLTGTVVTFAYDNDFRLTGISRPNGVNTACQYDAAGRLVRVQAGGIIDLRSTFDAAGRVVAATGVAPVDPSAGLTASDRSLEYDAASQVSSPGYVYDARGRLASSPGATCTWDGASRLTGLTRPGQAVTFAYNGLGDVVSRTEAGKTTGYLYNKAISGGPVVAERAQGTGQFLRYYVYEPSGGLLYQVDATDGNRVYHYHFDQTGNVLALTDGAGNVADAYAYDPFGTLLAHSGASDQPFTFLGRYGVRREGDLYQTRRRWYDPRGGRFVSREPLWPAIYDPVRLNPYQYAGLDPARNVDWTGAYHYASYSYSDLYDLRQEKLLEDYKAVSVKYIQAQRALAKTCGEAQGVRKSEYEKADVALRSFVHLNATWFAKIDRRRDRELVGAYLRYLERVAVFNEQSADWKSKFPAELLNARGRMEAIFETGAGNIFAGLAGDSGSKPKRYLLEKGAFNAYNAAQQKLPQIEEALLSEECIYKSEREKIISHRNWQQDWVPDPEPKGVSQYYTFTWEVPHQSLWE